LKHIFAAGSLKHFLALTAGEDMEDLISIGTIGLIKAIESFSPDQGTNSPRSRRAVSTMKS
jgi:hypothetical protein